MKPKDKVSVQVHESECYNDLHGKEEIQLFPNSGNICIYILKYC